MESPLKVKTLYSKLNKWCSLWTLNVLSNKFPVVFTSKVKSLLGYFNNLNLYLGCPPLNSTTKSSAIFTIVVSIEGIKFPCESCPCGAIFIGTSFRWT